MVLWPERADRIVEELDAAGRHAGRRRRRSCRRHPPRRGASTAFSASIADWTTRREGVPSVAATRPTPQASDPRTRDGTCRPPRRGGRVRFPWALSGLAAFPLFLFPPVPFRNFRGTFPSSTLPLRPLFPANPPRFFPPPFLLLLSIPRALPTPPRSRPRAGAIAHAAFFPALAFASRASCASLAATSRPPSRIAQTTRLAPRTMSPAANTPSSEVISVLLSTSNGAPARHAQLRRTEHRRQLLGVEA